MQNLRYNLPYVSSGGTVSANDFNRLLDYVSRLANVTGTAPLEVIQEETGTHLRLAPDDIIPVTLTAYDVTTKRYSWTEDIYNDDGTRKSDLPPRTGSTTYQPAYETNSSIVPIPTKVTIKRTLLSKLQGPVYEFTFSCGCGTSVTIPPPNSCCVVWSGSSKSFDTIVTVNGNKCILRYIDWVATPTDCRLCSNPPTNLPPGPGADPCIPSTTLLCAPCNAPPPASCYIWCGDSCVPADPAQCAAVGGGGSGGGGAGGGGVTGGCPPGTKPSTAGCIGCKGAWICDGTGAIGGCWCYNGVTPSSIPQQTPTKPTALDYVISQVYNLNSVIAGLTNTDTVNTVATTTTVSNATATIYTVPLPTSGQTVFISVDYEAWQTGGSSCGAGASYGASKITRFKNLSGTVTQVGSTVNVGLFAEGTLGCTDPSLSFNVSGTNIQIQVTGSSNQNFNHSVRVKTLLVSN